MNIFILFVFCVLFSIVLGEIFESDALLMFGALDFCFLWIFVILVKLFRERRNKNEKSKRLRC